MVGAQTGCNYELRPFGCCTRGRTRRRVNSPTPEGVLLSVGLDVNEAGLTEKQL